jgi:hypothetical protein
LLNHSYRKASIGEIKVDRRARIANAIPTDNPGAVGFKRNAESPSERTATFASFAPDAVERTNIMKSLCGGD